MIILARGQGIYYRTFHILHRIAHWIRETHNNWPNAHLETFVMPSERVGFQFGTSRKILSLTADLLVRSLASRFSRKGELRPSVRLPSFAIFTTPPPPYSISSLMWVSDPGDLLPIAEEEAELVDHGLHNFFEVWPHGLKLAQVSEFVPQKGRPPTNGQVFAVHAVILAPLSHSERRQIMPHSAKRREWRKSILSESYGSSSTFFLTLRSDERWIRAPRSSS